MKKKAPFYTLSSKREPPRRIINLSKDEKVLRKMRLWVEGSRSGSKDTRYLWEPSTTSKDDPRRISFDLIHLSKSLISSKDPIGQILRWPIHLSSIKIDFHWPSDLSRAIASSKDQIFTNTLDFGNLQFKPFKFLKVFRNDRFEKLPVMKFCKGQFYEVFRLARYRIEHQHQLIKNKIKLKIFLDFDKIKDNNFNILWMLSNDITANVVLICTKRQNCLK